MTSKRHAEWDFNPAEPQMLQEYDDTLLMWNVNAANKNSNPAMCVLLTFLVDFAVHQNIMACKALTYN